MIQKKSLSSSRARRTGLRFLQHNPAYVEANRSEERDRPIIGPVGDNSCRARGHENKPTIRYIRRIPSSNLPIGTARIFSPRENECSPA